MIKIHQGRWSIACVCMVLGFMVAVQLRTTEDMKGGSVSYQRIEEITDRLVSTEQERDGLKEELSALRKQKADEAGGSISEEIENLSRSRSDCNETVEQLRRDIGYLRTLIDE